MMSSNHNDVVELLNDIKFELEEQLRTAKKDNEINAGRLNQLAGIMPNRLISTDLNSETKSSLVKFSNTIMYEATTLENLKMRLEDVEKILRIMYG